MTRTLHYAAGAVCAVLAIVVIAETRWPGAGAAASPAESQAADPATAAGEAAPPADLDALTADILDRPLFTASRHPPAEPVAQQRDDGPVQRSAPVLTGRLGGMMIGPGEEREAIFAREGEKPLAVKEGDQIDGYTVESIQPDKVVLSSEFGDRTEVPKFGGPGEGAAAGPALARRAPNIPSPGPPSPAGLMQGQQRPANLYQTNRAPVPPGIAGGPNAPRPNVLRPDVRRNQR